MLEGRNPRLPVVLISANKAYNILSLQLFVPSKLAVAVAPIKTQPVLLP